MTGNIQIISVVNNHRVFTTTIKENPFMARYPVHVYDNTRENIGIPGRYNHFIDHAMADDAWLVFCHQDFGFLEDPSGRLGDLDTGVIYGPIGARRERGIYIRHGRIAFEKKALLGQIYQARNDDKFFPHGIRLSKPRLVDTVDCCCLIVHASLVRRFSLRFDEQLDFHLYAEDFSLNARFRHGVATKAVQMEAKHLSFGDTSKGFSGSLAYLRSKYPGRHFVGTCF